MRDTGFKFLGVFVAFFVLFTLGWLIMSEPIPVGAETSLNVGDDRGLDIARSQIPLVTAIDQSGNNANVATSYEPIWDEGDQYTYSATAELMHFSSSSAGDTQLYTVYGCDGDYIAVSQQITMVGQTETAMTQLMLRVWRITNDGATDNAGDVYVYSDDTVSSGVPQTQSKIRAKIIIGNNETQMCIRTIPDGETGYLVHAKGSGGGNQISAFKFRAREEGGVFQVKFFEYAFREEWDREFLIPLRFPEHTDIELMARASTGTDEMSGRFTIILMAD